MHLTYRVGDDIIDVVGPTDEQESVMAIFADDAWWWGEVAKLSGYQPAHCVHINLKRLRENINADRT